MQREIRVVSKEGGRPSRPIHDEAVADNVIRPRVLARPGTAVKRIDVLIAIAVLLAAAGSAVGIFTYEDDRGTNFRVAWTTFEETVDAEPVTFSGNGQRELTFQVGVRNVTTAEVAVTVGSAPGALAPIDVLLELTIPGLNETIVQEEQLPTASQGATFTIPVTLASLPNATTIRATSEEDVAARLAGDATSEIGFGEWVLLVSVATTIPDPVGTVSHTIEATATLQVYQPEATVDVPEAGR